MNKQRYPGPKPFEAAQSDLFFGRKKEEERLLGMLQNNQLSVLYGPSGYGKSSLLNASVIPEMEKDGYYTINVRLGAWTPQSTTTPLRSTVQGLSDNSDDLIESILDEIVPFDTSLWYFTKTFQLNTKKPKLLFVFDQFEELFTYPASEITQYGNDLAELLHTGLPQRYRDSLKKNTQHKDHPQYDDVFSDLDIKIVMAIRSNRFHLLERLTPILPKILSHTMELNALSREGGRTALVKPAQMDGDDFKCRKFTYAPQAETAILSFLSQDDKIEGILLQILCAHFEQIITDHPSKDKIELSDIEDGNTKDSGLHSIVDLYYSRRIQSLPEDQREGVERFIEDGLVQKVGNGGMRLSMHQAQVIERFGLNEEILTKLVRMGLLRTDPFLRGGVTYELTHDRLLDPVLRAKAAYEEEESNRLKEQLQAEARKAKEEKQLRIKAEEAQKIAEEQKQKALIAQQQAEEQKQKAIIAQQQAETNARRARRFAWASGITMILAVGLGLFALNSLNTVKEERAEKSLLFCKELLSDAKRLVKAEYCKSAKGKIKSATELIEEHAYYGSDDIQEEYEDQHKILLGIQNDLENKEKTGACRQ